MGKEGKGLKFLSKKNCIIIGIIVVAIVIIWIVLGAGKVGFDGGKTIDFEVLSKDNIPKDIETEVIPEYRELERALGCIVENKVYVVVTRGEKHSSGYGVKIDKIVLEREDGKTNMKVYAMYEDPKEGESYSNKNTYPYEVALVDISTLPDTIELITKY